MGLVQEYLQYGESLYLLILGICPPYRSTWAKLASLVAMLAYVWLTFFIIVVASTVTRLLPGLIPTFMSILNILTPKDEIITPHSKVFLDQHVVGPMISQ